jgi:hypothetical protein
MEAWEVQKQLYREQGRTEDQAHEDLIARRVLRGMGARNAQRDICVMEQRVLGEVNREQPLWPRTKLLFTTLLQRIPLRAQLVRSWDIQAMQVKNHTDAVERMTICERYATGDVPLLFTRVGNSKISRVYVIWSEGFLNSLTPPFEVVRADLACDLRLVVQETTEFVRSLGPYPLETFE